jgi:hypothetical protein
MFFPAPGWSGPRGIHREDATNAKPVFKIVIISFAPSIAILATSR